MLREPNPLLQQSKNKNINIVAVSWSIIHALFNINKNNANLHGSNPPHPDPTTDTGIGAGFGGATGKHAQPQLQPQLHLYFLDIKVPPLLGPWFQCNLFFFLSIYKLYFFFSCFNISGIKVEDIV